MSICIFILALYCTKNRLETVVISGIKNKLIIALGALTLLNSCNDIDVTDNSVLPELELQSFIFTEDTINLNIDASGFSHIVWEVSDGSVYNSLTANHVFNSSGDFEIKAIGYQGELKKDSSIHNIQVYTSSRHIELDEEFFALRSNIVNNQIIIEGVYHGEQQTTFLKFDNDLNLLGSFNSQDLIGIDAFTDIVIDGQVYSYNTNNTSVKFSGLKSAHDYFNPESFYTPGLFKYANGLARCFVAENADIQVEYYSSDLDLLWTKTFSGKDIDDKKYIFNLNDKLFFIGFSKDSDNLIVEKFKNISLSYISESLSLGIPAIDREVLFAIQNVSKKRIDLAIYSQTTDLTYIFSINENCNINLIGEIPGRMEGSPIEMRVDGTFFFKGKSSLVKFDSDWNVLGQFNLNSNYSHFGQLGDNLYLVCESISDKFKLSFLDKNLQKVAF